MITGLQIRAAQRLLGWNSDRLARACKRRIERLVQAESVEGEPSIPVVQAGAIRGVLERAGVAFLTGATTDMTLRTRLAASLNRMERQPSALGVAGSSPDAVRSHDRLHLS